MTCKSGDKGKIRILLKISVRNKKEFFMEMKTV